MTCVCYVFVLLSLFLYFLDDLPHLPSRLYVKHYEKEKERSRYDYAASDPGGLIVGHSIGIVGAKNILKRDKDKYLLVPCSKSEKWVEVSLLETILIDEVQVVQGEIYSSSFEIVEIQYSIDYPSENWTHLVTLRLEDSSKAQKFKVSPTWVRFLRLVLLNHYRNEYYCTLTQFSAFGSNIFQSLNDDYLKEREKMRNRNESNEVISIEDDQNDDWNTNKWRVSDFDDKEPETQENCCKANIYYDFTCQGNSSEVQVFQQNKETSINVFGEMIKHMAKSETKIDQLFSLLNKFNRMQKNYDEKFRLLEKHFALLELQVLVNQESIENIKFWMIFFTVLFLIGMLLIVYITAREAHKESSDSRGLSPRKKRGQYTSCDVSFSDSDTGSVIKKIVKKHTR
jgi:phage shock protein PspC (stress-responsive transcriptional regulator)